MRKLLIATRNRGKLHELSAFLPLHLPFQIVSLADLKITEDVDENGKTYEDNAKKKALFFAKKSGLPALADDGGLEIAALSGEPGVKSRRWIGEHATDEQLAANMQKVAKKLPSNNRAAKFVVCLALALPDGKVFTSRGVIKGIIAEKPFTTVSKGYPYRLFFYLPKIKRYYHEDDLSKDQMQRLNHRFAALSKLLPRMRRALLS